MLCYVMYSHFHPNIILLPSHHSTSHSTSLLHLLCLASMLTHTKISVLISIILQLFPFNITAIIIIIMLIIVIIIILIIVIMIIMLIIVIMIIMLIIVIIIIMLIIVITIIMLMVAIRQEKLACLYQRTFALT